ncbi:hypothetical protein HO173_001621 [Letharia columbiana]|uniref:Uncharacterized protein n=1 Tax=Letharia columbiana TaxID=112416 RepID=A0A8H6L912_9LECA|nr:uncharacterized protein HO173_001621 [Letharia columbiana]KAF6240013.1 hypothetical protein HO173_001621 [Letharia columbiana]
MAIESQYLGKLQEYVTKTKDIDYGQNNADGDEDYAARLCKSLQSLQNQVKQHEAALERLRATARAVSVDEPSEDSRQRLQQLRTVTAAYRSLTPSEPLLPSPDSPLPALLALRKTLNMVDQSKSAITETKDNVSKSRKHLRQEEADLRDARSITQALEGRIEKLRLENEERSEKSTEESANTIIQEQQQRKRHYMMALRDLVKAFNKFVDEQLAAMLAAEDLGGPTVGDSVEVDEEMLKAGFNQQGRARKMDADIARTEAKRKMRNDEIWGSENGNEDEEIGVRSEKEAALASFRTLTEDLLNAAAGDEDSDSYINISRESAAVRFLVRAKVAQFHTDDARKLRLVDFGRGWDN